VPIRHKVNVKLFLDDFLGKISQTFVIPIYTVWCDWICESAVFVRSRQKAQFFATDASLHYQSFTAKIRQFASAVFFSQTVGNPYEWSLVKLW